MAVVATMSGGLTGGDCIRLAIETGENAPLSVDNKEIDPLPMRAKEVVEALSWVRRSKVRFREEGRFITGDVFVVPEAAGVDPEWIGEAEERVRQLDWRLAQVSIIPLPHISGVQEQAH